MSALYTPTPMSRGKSTSPGDLRPEEQARMASADDAVRGDPGRQVDARERPFAPASRGAGRVRAQACAGTRVGLAVPLRLREGDGRGAAEERARRGTGRADVRLRDLRCWRNLRTQRPGPMRIVPNKRPPYGQRFP